MNLEHIAAALEAAAKRIREHGIENEAFYFSNPGDQFEDGIKAKCAKDFFDTFIESGGDDGWPDDAESAEWGIQVAVQTVRGERSEASDTDKVDLGFDFILALKAVNQWGKS